MTIRLYLPSTGTPSISPTPDAVWDKTGGMQPRRLMVLTRIGSATVSTTASVAAVPEDDVLYRQYLYALPTDTEFTTAQTFRAQVGADGAAADNMGAQIVVRILDSTGTVERATLYAEDLTTGLPADEFNGNLNFVFPPNAPVNLQATYTTVAGDWLCVEIGARVFATRTVALRMYFGDGDVDDLTATNAVDSGASHNPWIEFSGDLASLGSAGAAQIIWGF